MAITFDPILNKLRKQDAGGTGAVDSVNGATGVVVLDQDDIGDGTTYKQYSATEKTKLSHISVTQAVDLDALETASHAAVTVLDSAEIDFTLTGQQITASLLAGSIDETKLDASVNASLDLADSSIQSLAGYLTSATAASTYQPLMGADDNYVTDAEKTALHPAVTLGTNTASALSLSTQALSIGDVFVQNTGDTIAGDLVINAGYRLGVGVAVSSLADIRVNSTSVNESSLYAGIWQSTSYAPAGTPIAGTSARGLLFQVSTPNVATNLSNVILYGALGQVTHGGSGALGQAIGLNPGVFLTGSGNVATSAGVTVSATSSGGGAHTNWFGLRSGGITLSGGSTMVSSYAFYADAVTGATNNYAIYTNAGLVRLGDTLLPAAGTTTVAPIKMTSGTNLTTVAAGVLEYNGKIFTASATDTNRGVVPSTLFTSNSADFVGGDVNTAQPVFEAARDTFTLDSDTSYVFEGFYLIARTAGTTSHTTATLFAGTATFANFVYTVQCSNGDGTAIAAVNSTYNTVKTARVITAANTSATEFLKIQIKGIMRVNAGGTFIPQFQYSAAPGGAPSVKLNSFFLIYAVGSKTTYTAGLLA